LSTILIPDEITSALDQLNTLAAEHAAQADRDGVLPLEVVTAIADAGVARHFVPARFGGTEGTFGELTAAMTTLGESCASASWVGSIFAYTARFVTHLPPLAQEEVWGASPDLLWASGLVPSGRSARTESGFRLSGRWAYVSGAEFADWVLLAGPQPEPGIEPPVFHAIPRGDFRVERTWDAIGMRATGSHTVVLEDVDVPAHRTVSLREVATGRNSTSATVQHNVPLLSLGGLTCVAPALGAARSALSTTIANASPRRAGMPPELRALFDDSFARSAVELDSAELLVDRMVGVLDSGQAPRLAIRNARDAGYAAQLIRGVVQRLMTAGGTFAQNRFGTLERSWRDVFTGTSHAALRFEKAASAYTDTQIQA
jgi:alkylation response protein AidB-like acyl-CoA dehydrogenase